MYEQGGSFAEGYAIGRDSNGGNGAWGNDGWWIIIILFALFGWGGFGGGFGAGNGGYGATGYELGKVATSSDIATGFSSSATLNGLNDLKLGQAGIQQTLCQGFSGVNQSIVTSGYETRSAINDLGYRLQDCCCQTQRAIDGVNYNMATNTCAIQNTINNSTRDIIDSQRAGTDTIIRFLTNEKISSLQAENQVLKFQASQAAQNAYISASQEAQTAELIRRLGRDCPTPAFIVPNPNCCYQNNSGCGCNNY